MFQPRQPFFIIEIKLIFSSFNSVYYESSYAIPEVSPLKEFSLSMSGLTLRNSFNSGEILTLNVSGSFA